jgi:diguanylate cyclase (GGDEF)-like protein/PAS domain S-box-containing protein
MVTGHGNEKVAVEAMKLGAADYVVKDVDMGYLELLPIVIDQVLDKQRLERERVEMLRTLRESEERYRLLVELTLDAICICEEGRFSFVNPAGLRLFGASLPGDLFGKAVSSAVHPDCRSDFEAKLDLNLPDKCTTDMSWIETKVMRFDGTVVDVEIAAVPFMHRGTKAVQIIVRDVTQLRVAAQRLEFLAHYDLLTGLPNRMLFYDRLSTAIGLARRDVSELALLFVDLDRFKNVNDTMGHEFGDLLLKQAAARIRSCVRQSDTVARIGGDEFTVIMPKINSKADAGVVAGKILAALSHPFTIQESRCSIGASVGIGLYPKDGEDSQTLLRAADIAMYCTKEKGGNSYHYHD